MVSTAWPSPPTSAALHPKPEWQLSPLELMLPTGRATRSLQLGSRALPSLLCAPKAGSGARSGRPAAAIDTPSSPTTPVDLYLLAPTDQECATPGWLASAVHHLAHTLSPDGLACLLVPPRYRPPLLKLLHQHPFTRPSPLLHYPYPGAANDAFMAPLNPALLGYAFDTLTPSRSPQQTLALTLLRLPAGRSLLQNTLPAATLIVRRPGALPRFDWLAGLSPAGHPPTNTIISFGRDGDERSALLHAFNGPTSHPTTIYKLALNPPAETARRREAANLIHLPLPTAVRLPATHPFLLKDGRLLLHQESLTGRVVARLLAAEPDRLPAFMSQVVDWLEQWHKATVVHQSAGPFLEQTLIHPARQLAPYLSNGDHYLQWLSDHITNLSGRPLPFVAAHHDLTTWNLLYDEQEGLAVLDWEAASAAALPLTDFYYALADAAAAAAAYRHRLPAFLDCFAPGGRWHSLTGRLQAQLCHALNIPPDLALLCFHACWLRHAANEQRKQLPPAERPFLAMVAWAAQHQTQSPEAR